VHRGTTCSVTTSALAEAGGQTQIAGGMSYGRGPDEIDLDEAAAEAVEHAVRLLGATKPPSARLTAVLMPSVTASFLGIIGGILSGEAVLKGRSLFATRVGEDVAGPIFTLADDATDADSFGAALDDDEGLASRRNELIAGGVLQGFLYNTYAGRRAGTGSTGSAVRGYASTPSVGTRGLALVPGERNQEELLAAIDNGVLVQSVSGLHSGVNPVSGDFSVGAAGLMIRNGQLAEPVQEMTVASTIQRMLLDVAAVGNDVRWLGSTAGVTLVIDDISLGGR
jgi:PmbA protein